MNFFVVVVEGMDAVTSTVVNTLLILCLHFSKQTAYCARGGVDDFFGDRGVGDDFFHSSLYEHSTIFLSGWWRRFWLLPHFGTQYCNKKIKRYFQPICLFSIWIENIYFCLFEKIFKCYYKILTKNVFLSFYPKIFSSFYLNIV